MATFIVTETRPNTSFLFVNDDPRYAESAGNLTAELAAAGIETTAETSPDGLVRTHTRTMTEDKILVFKEIYERNLEELTNLVIANNDQGHWGTAEELPDPSTGILLKREFDDFRSYQIYQGEIVL